VTGPTRTPNWEWALYWLLVLGIACGALVIGGEIREAWISLAGSLEGALR
jgi:hypothetical protein